MSNVKDIKDITDIKELRALLGLGKQNSFQSMPSVFSNTAKKSGGPNVLNRPENPEKPNLPNGFLSQKEAMFLALEAQTLQKDSKPGSDSTFSAFV